MDFLGGPVVKSPPVNARDTDSIPGPGTIPHCCFSVTQSCLTLCDPMGCSTPGFPVHHQLLELAQTHVLWVSDAIQPSHPLFSPCSSYPQSFPATESFPMNQFFASSGQSTGTILPMNIQGELPLGPTGLVSLLLNYYPKEAHGSSEIHQIQPSVRVELNTHTH